MWGAFLATFSALYSTIPLLSTYSNALSNAAAHQELKAHLVKETKSRANTEIDGANVI